MDSDIEINGNPGRALVDPHTTGASIISSTYAATYDLLTIPFEESITVDLALQGSRGKSMHYVIAKLDIGGNTETVTFCVAALADWDIILGEALLRQLSTKLDIAKGNMTILSNTSQTPITIKATSNRNRYTP